MTNTSKVKEETNLVSPDGNSTVGASLSTGNFSNNNMLKNSLIIKLGLSNKFAYTRDSKFSHRFTSCFVRTCFCLPKKNCCVQQKCKCLSIREIA